MINLTQNKTRTVPHLRYVALSRVRSMQNLYILGATLDKVVIDLTQNKTRKVPHLCYAALSRVK